MLSCNDQEVGNPRAMLSNGDHQFATKEIHGLKQYALCPARIPPALAPVVW
jgi:hypothetical protein